MQSYSDLTAGLGWDGPPAVRARPPAPRTDSPIGPFRQRPAVNARPPRNGGERFS